MWKVTLRDIRENFGRFLMSVIAVSIGVAFLTGTPSLRDVLGATFSNPTSATITEDVYVTGPERGEIIIEESTSVRSGIEVGDAVVVYVNEPVPMDVVGKFEFGTSMAGASVIMMNEEELIETVDAPITNITIRAGDGADPDEVKASIVQQLPDEYGVLTAAELKEKEDDVVSGILNIINTFLLVFVVSALAISTFIITNTFTISVRQRQFALRDHRGLTPRGTHRSHRSDARGERIHGKAVARSYAHLAVSLAVGVALVAYGATNDSGIAFGVGAGLLLLAIIGVMPALMAPAAATLGWIFRKLSPATGVLASRSLVASPRKTASTAVALAIGVALVSAGSSVAASIKETTAGDIDTNFEADIFVSANANVTDTAVARQLVEDVDGVVNVDDSVVTGMAALVAVDGEPRDHMSATGFISSHATDGFGMTYKSGSSAAIDDGKAAIYDWVSESVGATVGSTIQLTTETGSVEIEVGAIVESGVLDFGAPSIMLPPSESEELPLIGPRKLGMLVDIEDGADSAQLSDDIRLALKEQYVWGVADQNRIKDISNSQADGVLTIVYALLGLSVIIAVLGVVNTLTLSIVDRVREIGLLRAVGMQRSGVRRMVVQESIIITLFGTVVGVVFGVPLGLALTRYLASDGEALYVVPWATMGVALLVGLVVGVLAAVLPARKAARMDVLDAIAEE